MLKSTQIFYPLPAFPPQVQPLQTSALDYRVPTGKTTYESTVGPVKPNGERYVSFMSQVVARSGRKLASGIAGLSPSLPYFLLPAPVPAKRPKPVHADGAQEGVLIDYVRASCIMVICHGSPSQGYLSIEELTAIFWHTNTRIIIALLETACSGIRIGELITSPDPSPFQRYLITESSNLLKTLRDICRSDFVVDDLQSRVRELREKGKLWCTAYLIRPSFVATACYRTNIKTTAIGIGGIL
ncbi:uncharacterized protein EI90DRAFT_3285976 [Cantharellus anzutake]|uniref:uncharacterized protein n=1 Tax=Cantharellus anzutake TaxID=1750568 RepID=UPI0019086044|nr:uncharacterized protein EI90DRAFT_3285976 [Cantharellus anzutake]KAF8340664.1 hypothetical protein EI90DRAFT_3285976 [Cantharellus anzutake]